MNPGWRCEWLLLALLALLSTSLAAQPSQSLQGLQASGQLQLTSKLLPAGPLVPGQKAALSFRISTNRWFAGGARITLPEVPGLVILQTEQFASNASESRSGESWVVQRWSLDVYAQRAGDFTVPPVRLQIKVNTADAGNVEGELLSDPIQFSAQVPEPLAQAEQWVAAPSFTVNQQFSRSLQDLKPGDAFDQVIVFEAIDVMAMMLPTVTASGQPGLASYPSPPELTNDSNRGELTARRSRRITYVVEAEGQFHLPAREFFWWDTVNGKLQLLTLPATDITVGAGVAAAQKEGTTLAPRQLLPVLAGLLLLGILVWIARRLLPQLPIQRLSRLLHTGWHHLQALRRPALPQKLNPDSSAGD